MAQGTRVARRVVPRAPYRARQSPSTVSVSAMPRYETSVATPWSAERAFEYLSDLEHFEEWDPGVTKAVRVEGDAPGVGAAYDVTVKSSMSSMTLRYETLVFAPPRRIEVLAETSSLRSFDVMTFDDRGDGGCVVTYTADLALKGFRAIGNPLLALAFKKIGDRAAQGLRRVLEGTEA